MSRRDREREHIDSDHGSGSDRGRAHHHGGYWDNWREERHRFYHGGDDRTAAVPGSQEVQAWRDYFHQFFGVWPEEHWIFSGRRFGPWQQGMDSFNPFVANLLSKGGGLLPLYVLYLVSQQPRYGNEIMDILAKRTNGQWVSNPGAIYPLLTQLEMGGFILGQWADPAKRTVRTYTITPGGQEELDRIKGVVAPKIEETIKVLQELLVDLQPSTSETDPSES